MFITSGGSDKLTGDISIQSSNGWNQTGKIDIQSGTSSVGHSGKINIVSGAVLNKEHRDGSEPSNISSGNVNIQSGDNGKTRGRSGTISIQTGQAIHRAGNIEVIGGTSVIKAFAALLCCVKAEAACVKAGAEADCVKAEAATTFSQPLAPPEQSQIYTAM